MSASRPERVARSIWGIGGLCLGVNPGPATIRVALAKAAKVDDR